jgi:sugar phosphate isomerase/epimerase
MKLGTMNLLAAPGRDPNLDAVRDGIATAAAAGLEVLGFSLSAGKWLDAVALSRTAELAEDRGIELRVDLEPNLYLAGADLDEEIERTARAMEILAEHARVRYASVSAGPILTTHRWMPGPPIDERIELAGRSLAAFADAALGSRMTLALENHCDYRGHEIRAMIELAGRPNLKAQLDTGNAFAVFEDPIDCAEALAEFVVSVHVKDVHVTPFSPPPSKCPGTRGVAVPLGGGHVDNAAICDILAERAPNPSEIALIIAPFYIAEDVDPQEFLTQSVGWARENLAAHLSASQLDKDRFPIRGKESI